MKFCGAFSSLFLCFRSSLGRLTGSFVVLFGIVVLAFPMTIIISKFQDSFTVKKLNANKEMTRKLREMAICRYSRSSNPSTPQTVNGKAHVPKQGTSEIRPIPQQGASLPSSEFQSTVARTQCPSSDSISDETGTCVWLQGWDDFIKLIFFDFDCSILKSILC